MGGTPQNHSPSSNPIILFGGRPPLPNVPPTAAFDIVDLKSYEHLCFGVIHSNEKIADLYAYPVS